MIRQISFDAWIEVPREGRYIFLVKDQDDRVALTNEVLVGQTSKFAVEVQATALTCASQPAGKITAKVLGSYGTKSEDTTLQVQDRWYGGY